MTARLSAAIEEKIVDTFHQRGSFVFPDLRIVDRGRYLPELLSHLEVGLSRVTFDPDRAFALMDERGARFTLRIVACGWITQRGEEAVKVLSHRLDGSFIASPLVHTVREHWRAPVPLHRERVAQTKNSPRGCLGELDLFFMQNPHTPGEIRLFQIRTVMVGAGKQRLRETFQHRVEPPHVHQLPEILRHVEGYMSNCLFTCLFVILFSFVGMKPPL